ncbi:hypothetical protein [Breznakiella homolactica]|uniref:Uncharacterized protein n=1 Tax=Breznakiella homolactica TaxID=2798577 RepID=A0A7T7XM83_9SPIR|nr:hypothetical protein [Breznakiella homolactica]QQO08843.1 hypothetical protein JFL75_18225 [Breznakiella homolactica]
MEDTHVTLSAYLQSGATKAKITGLISENLLLLKSINSQEYLRDYASSLYNWFFRECINYNQFIGFSGGQCRTILSLYKKLIVCLGDLSVKASPDDIGTIVDEHRRALLETIAAGHTQNREPEEKKLCAEYSTAVQKAVMRMDPAELPEPILDIGCGENAFFLRDCLNAGRDAYGLDYFLPKIFPHRICTASWLEYNFGTQCWGSIISHMAFTNHWAYHLAHGTAETAAYRKAYTRILESLKPGGCFYCVPAVPDMEKITDRTVYRVRRYDNFAAGINIPSARVERINPSE